ncbi:hypothetical protein [Actinoplanes subglobosus]|uniref:Uncharacterized protein n=1 Tax=Actinoplanes subglobosus TaxID=1547892 RepID=A0ABV8IYA2_9ACTN
MRAAVARRTLVPSRVVGVPRRVVGVHGHARNAMGHLVQLVEHHDLPLYQ